MRMTWKLAVVVLVLGACTQAGQPMEDIMDKNGKRTAYATFAAG